MTVTIDLPSDVASQALLAARAQGKDLATYVADDVRRLLRSDVLSETETGLLEVVNRPIDANARRERDQLLSLQAKRDLTEAEHDRLTNLIDAVELANAERWQAIASLAVLRGRTIAEMAQDLQIPQP